MSARKPLKKRVRLLQGGEEEGEMKNTSSKSLVESSKSDSSKSSLRKFKRPRMSDGANSSSGQEEEEEVKSKKVKIYFTDLLDELCKVPRHSLAMGQACMH